MEEPEEKIVQVLFFCTECITITGRSLVRAHQIVRGVRQHENINSTGWLQDVFATSSRLGTKSVDVCF